MGPGLIIVAVFACIIIAAVRADHSPAAKVAQAEANERQRKVICPHCHEAGGVSRRLVRRKRGISGGKATGAVLTGGVSMLATGLSRKEDVTNLSCSNCGMSWDV